MILLLPSKAT